MCSTRVAVHHGAGLGLQRPAPPPRLQHDRVAAVEEHRGLEAGAGAEARVHEDHRQHLPLQAAGDLAALDPRRPARAAPRSRRGTSPRARGSRAWSREHLLESSQQQVGLVGGERERRQQPEHLRVRRGAGDDAPARTAHAAPRRPAGPRCRPSSRPRPLTCRTPSARAPRGEARADPDRVLDETLALDHVDGGERGRAGHRSAAERAAEVADADRRGHGRPSRSPRRSGARRRAPWRT